MCDSKILIPRAVSEDVLTQTPRSQLNSDGSTVESPNCSSRSPIESRSGSMSDGDSDDESVKDGENDGYREDDYYAFLRELAGSFEATGEDDESEVGSDSEGSSDEDETGTAVGRKRSSGLSCSEGDPENGWPVSPSPVGHGRAHGAGNPEEEKEDDQQECSKAAGTSGASAPAQSPAQPPLARGGYPQTTTARAFFFKPQGQEIGAESIGGRCARRNPPAPISLATVPGADDEVKRRQMATPSADRRGPVIDDYDVGKATAEFAEQRATSSRSERQREDLADFIQMRKNQAAKLLGISRNKRTDPELRSHYARVRSDHLAEVRALESQLEVLVEAQQREQTHAGSPSCSMAEGAAAQDMMGHQETAFGGHASAARGVVVQ